MGPGLRCSLDAKDDLDAMHESNYDSNNHSNGRWLCIEFSLHISWPEGEDKARKDPFCKDISRLFDLIQKAFSHLGADERARSGQDGVAAEIILKIDLQKKEVVLDRLYKYCDLETHIFTELLEILQRNFPDCYLVVPTLQGYELAKEIKRFLGPPEIECIYLKADGGERLLMGGLLQGIGFEEILEGTERHYQERGGVEKKRQELGPGRELSMYHQGPEAEEEILWMQVRIELLRSNLPNALQMTE